MAHVIISDECLGCQACAGVCPAEAISETELGYCVVDADLCCDCGACEDVCPIGVIGPEPD